MPNWIIKEIKELRRFPIMRNGEVTGFGALKRQTLRVTVYHVKDGPEQCFTITRTGMGRPENAATTYSIKAPMGYKLQSMGIPVFTDECENLFKDISDELLRILL